MVPSQPATRQGQYPKAIGTFQVLYASSALSFALGPPVNVFLLVRND